MPQSASHAAAAEKHSNTKPSEATHHGEEKKAHSKPDHEFGAKTGKPITTQNDLTKDVEPAEKD